MIANEWKLTLLGDIHTLHESLMLLLGYNLVRRYKIMLERIHLKAIHEEEGQPEIPCIPYINRGLMEDRYDRFID